MARSRKTVAFSEAALRALRRVDKHGKRHGAAAVNAWAEVVGAEVATHTRGFALRDNRELQVFVDGGAWANQLSLMSSDLIARLNEHLGEESVRSLRFTVSRKVNQEVVNAATEDQVKGFYAVDESRRVALTQTELSQAKAVASAIKQESLREAALKAMVKDLELKKGSRTNRATPVARQRPEDGPTRGL